MNDSHNHPDTITPMAASADELQNDIDIVTEDDEKENVGPVPKRKKIEEEIEEKKPEPDEHVDTLTRRVELLELENHRLKLVHQSTMESISSKIENLHEIHTESTKMSMEKREKTLEMYRKSLKKTNYLLRVSIDIVEKQNEILMDRTENKQEFEKLNEQLKGFEEVLNDYQAPPVLGRWLSDPPPPPPMMEPEEPVEEEKPTCIFCSAHDHLSANCTHYRTPIDRRFKLIDIGNCIKCLEPKNMNHEPMDPCPNKKTVCQNCVENNPIYDPQYDNHHEILMPRTYREIKREESGSTGSNEGNSIQSQDFRKMNEKLSKEVHDLRALLQSTSKLHNSKLDSLQAQFTDVLRRTSRENQELRQVLQVQLDTIIQMVSGGPWMFNQAPPEFTQPPVPQNFPHEYAVNQGAPPPTQIPGFDDIGIPQLSQNFARFEGEISDVSQKQQGSFECLKVPGTGTRLPVTTAHVEKTDIENCLFCNDQKHKSQNCTVIKDAGQRMGFVRENQICEKCLKPLDRHEPCIMEICTICKKKKKHNPVLCSTIENRHCSFCLSRDHYYQECPKYSIGVSVTDRRAMLEEEDRCLTCFKGNRVGYHDSCRTRYLCSTCMKKFNDPKIAVHQKSLCLESKSSMPRKEKESSRYAPY